MDFPRDFFLDEVRDGFFVPSMMKKSWASAIENYEKLSKVCKKHGIKLYASWGTLIAAIRHGGFIPWDDDLDVMMLREDYERLGEILKKEPDIGDYHLQDFKVTGGNNMFRQWLEKSVYIYSPDEWERRHGFPFGDVIDVFVLDHIPKDISERMHQAEVIGACNNLQLLAAQIYGDSNTRQKQKETKQFREAMEAAEKLLGTRFTFKGELPIRIQILDILDKFIASYAKKDQDDNLADIPNYLGNKDRLLPREYFDDTIDVPYEYGTISVPIAYDSILKRYYGQFMTPQIAVNYGHVYPVYEKYSGQLKEKFGFELLHYKYDHARYNEIINMRESKVPLHETLDMTLDLIREAHSYILGVIHDLADNDQNDHEFNDDGNTGYKTPDVSSAGKISIEKINEAIELLEQCQMLVISLGSKIEVRIKKHEDIIQGLTDYCETVYAAHEMINGFLNGEIPDALEIKAISDGLFDCEKLLDDIKDICNSELKEILIISDRSVRWDAIQGIWESYTSDENNHVSVVAMPYKYKDATWLVPEGEWESDITGYPDPVRLIPYEEYDIRLIHPDEIIYTFPYDGYSDVIEPHPDYYTETLVRYTDKMVFVEPFTLREIATDDSRSRYTLGRFIKTPGSVYADEIVVQSESMKGVYVELLGTVTSEIDWEKRITVRDDVYPGIPTAKSDNTSVKTREEQRKTVLVYFSGSMLFDHSEAIDKINNVIDLFESQKSDIIPIWVMDPYAEKILKNRRDAVWQGYLELIKRIKASKVWQIDDGVDLDSLAMVASAMYGDAGVLMNNCRMLGKPVMWENPEIQVEM